MMSSVLLVRCVFLQQVVGGKHRKYQYSIDDYIFAALTLYMDIVVLFMNILSLTSNS